ncbi:hypothetical protein E6H29_02225 [Candidatus Bathyarchaeota archaeon]|nr:MAG: hypothetical protein AUJ07_01455 [Crenarchaeota archaeon 13_1_40CM_3_53_5]TMI32434.1 MAG: hypothetical protein E6H29_02225 [Candidatus Bathyarchaeota archaeon]
MVVGMTAPALHLHNKRNLLFCIGGMWLLFSIGAGTVLSIAPKNFLSEAVPRLPLSLELGVGLMLFVGPLAVLIGFIYMYIFGGFLSTRAMKLYLFIMRGRHVVTPRKSEYADLSVKKGLHLKLRRQFVYFFFILCVVVSFATYLAKRRALPLVATYTRTTDIASTISQDFVTLTMSASLMLPVLTLALPYFGGLRVRSIDTGKFHTTLIEGVVSASGGFSLLYTLLERPAFYTWEFYVLILMGVCWCFALGCNLAAEPANRKIERIILGMNPKPGSRLVSSRIMLEDFAGHLIEV